MNEIVSYTTGGTLVTLSPQIIKEYLCKTATDQEIFYFLRLCEAQKLNPFIREVYLIKFGNNPASMVVGKEALLKRAQAQAKFKGYQAGIMVVANDGQLVYREGQLVITGETLVGGWCKVYVDGWSFPVAAEVSMTEYDKGQSSWRSMPATMIRKVALCQALREAFPDALGALYGAEEMGIKEEALDDAPIQQPTASQKASQGVVIDVTPEPKIETLTREHQDEVWRLLQGRGDLVSILLKRIGKVKLADVNDAAFPKLMKMVAQLVEHAGLGSDLSGDTATDEPYYVQSETEAQEAPTGVTEDIHSFFEYVEDLIGGSKNADEVEAKVLEHFRIERISELRPSDAVELDAIVEKYAVPF